MDNNGLLLVDLGLSLDLMGYQVLVDSGLSVTGFDGLLWTITGLILVDSVMTITSLMGYQWVQTQPGCTIIGLILVGS